MNEASDEQEQQEEHEDDEDPPVKDTTKKKRKSSASSKGKKKSNSDKGRKESFVQALTNDSHDYTLQWPMKIPLYEMWIRNLETSIQRASSSDVFVSLFSAEIARASSCTANRVIATGTTPSSELSTMIFVGNCKQLHHLLMESDADTSATNRCLMIIQESLKDLSDVIDPSISLSCHPFATGRDFNDGK